MADRVEGTSAVKRAGRFTAGDYWGWPEDERWELIDGVAYAMSPAPRRRHQELVARLLADLDVHFRSRPCSVLVSPLDVYWTDCPDEDLREIETVTQPDIVVVCDPTKLIDEGVRGAPDFVIEITSPSTMWRDHNDKLRVCERFGVREYWLVNPNTLEVTIYTMAAGDRTYGLPVVRSLADGVGVEAFEGLVLLYGEVG